MAKRRIVNPGGTFLGKKRKEEPFKPKTFTIIDIAKEWKGGKRFVAVDDIGIKVDELKESLVMMGHIEELKRINKQIDRVFKFTKD